MTFKKLALATAIASLPMAAMAVDTLDDSMLGGVTGQDGITVSLDLNLTGLQTILHDTTGIDDYNGSVTYDHTATFPADTIVGPTGTTVTSVVSNVAGVPNAAGIYYQPSGSSVAGNSGDAPVVVNGALAAYDYTNAGAIRITGTSVVANNATIQIDAGSSAQTLAGGVLNIAVNLPSAVITTGSIAVGNSNRDDAVPVWGGTNWSADLLSSSTLTLGNVDLNIQLGEEPQGNMIRVDTSISGGLSVNGFAMNDVGGAVTGGSIGAGNILVNDNGAGTDLTNVVVGIDVDAAEGLVVNIIGLGNGGMDVYVEGVYLGTNPGLRTNAGFIGDVEMHGMNLAGTRIALTGK